MRRCRNCTCCSKRYYNWELSLRTLQNFKKTCKKFELQDFGSSNLSSSFWKWPEIVNIKSKLYSKPFLQSSFQYNCWLPKIHFYQLVSGHLTSLMTFDKPGHNIIISVTQNSYNTQKLKKVSVGFWSLQLKRLWIEYLDINFE